MLWVRRGSRESSDCPGAELYWLTRTLSRLPKHPALFLLLFPQFTKRVQLLLMPPKHQPDLLLLRHVPLSRVHLFTAIQLACLGLLWIIKSTPAAIIFPIMVTQGWVASWEFLRDSEPGRMAKASIRGRLFPLAFSSGCAWLGILGQIKIAEGC